MRLRIDFDNKTGDSFKSRFFGSIDGVDVWVPAEIDWTLSEDELAKMSRALVELKSVVAKHNLKFESVMVTL